MLLRITTNEHLRIILGDLIMLINGQPALQRLSAIWSETKRLTGKLTEVEVWSEAYQQFEKRTGRSLPFEYIRSLLKGESFNLDKLYPKIEVLRFKQENNLNRGRTINQLENTDENTDERDLSRETAAEAI